MAYDGNPPTNRTGAGAIGGKPAESLCTSCHGGTAVNVGGSVEIIGLPAAYVPGVAYDLTVRVTSGQTAANSGRLWGFELTVVEGINGNGTGTLANISGQGTSTAAGTGNFTTRSYVRSNSGNHSGAASPVDWQVRWTAPDPAPGPVHLFFTGVAANGASGANGDWTYTGNAVIPQASTGVQGSTWSGVKALFVH